MPLTLSQVDHIANLARLALSDEEKALFAQQLSAILEYVARLQELDTSEVQPTTSVSMHSGVLRSDQPKPGLPAQVLLQTAPEVENDQFRIPPVFE
jgi:aspartyl-tRNA(Asn)/glutamyl-tRNA(Gln) amidotransferase subunit C